MAENQLSTIVDLLLAWYQNNKRSLPWREAPSPYHVWVSEIMLQQTRIEAVLPYYERFIQRLPTVRALAETEDDELMKLWEGLGYYSRARHLKEAAVRIMEEYDGVLPGEVDSLVRLPGIGSYTAGAISSIAYGRPEPAVDGNVLRVLMRFQNREDDVMSQRLRREVESELRSIMRGRFPEKGTKTQKDRRVTEAAEALGDTGWQTPGAFNQALMELGETVCIPGGEPRCVRCPLREVCAGYAAGRAGELPVRSRGGKRRIEKRTILRILDPEGRIYIRKRPSEGLLARLWELPSVTGHIRKKDVPAAVRRILAGEDPGDGREEASVPEAGASLRDSLSGIRQMNPARHVFSHVEWEMTGYEVRVPAQDVVAGRWASPQDLEKKVALPKAFSAYSLHE